MSSKKKARQKLPSIQERMKSHLLTHGFKSLNDPEFGQWRKYKGKADYLLADPCIVIEQKELESPDTGPIMGLHRFIVACSGKYGIPLRQMRLEGDMQQERWDRDDVKQFEDLLELAVERFKRLFRDASGQIRDTCEVLKLPNAHGVLLVLNQKVGHFPDNVCSLAMLTAFLPELKPGGAPDYPEIGAYCYIHRNGKGNMLDGKRLLISSVPRITAPTKPVEVFGHVLGTFGNHGSDLTWYRKPVDSLPISIYPKTK